MKWFDCGTKDNFESTANSVVTLVRGLPTALSMYHPVEIYMPHRLPPTCTLTASITLYPIARAHNVARASGCQSAVLGELEPLRESRRIRCDSFENRSR